MSTSAIGNTTFSSVSISGADSEILIQYLATEQAKASQDVMQSFAQGVTQLQNLLKNTLQSLHGAAPLEAEAEALDAKLSWTVDRGDTSAISSSQNKAHQDAQGADSAASSAAQAANAANSTPAGEAAKLADEAANAAEKVATTDSPMTALASAQVATQKANEASQKANSAKKSSSQELTDAQAAESDAQSALDSAKTKLAGAKTDEEKAAAKTKVDAAKDALDDATEAVGKAKQLDKAADAAVVAANAAVKAASSAQAAAKLLAEPKEIALDNGNKLLVGPEAGHWTIVDANGEKLSISGDLKVTDPNDPNVQWTIGADSTFVLSDGTKISLDTAGGKASGLTITKGDQLITVSGMEDDTPTISDSARGGRAKDAATNDGHVFMQGENGWTHQGESISKGAKLAQTELQNELALETNDIEMPQELRDFLEANGLTFKDNDQDGKLNADEWKELVAKLQSFTTGVAQQSTAALTSMLQAAGTLIDFSAKLNQMLQNQSGQAQKLQQAAQDAQRLAKDLAIHQLQDKQIEKRAQELLDTISEALEQASNASNLFAKTPLQDTSSISSSDRTRVDQEVAQWKAELEQTTGDPTPKDEPPHFKTESNSQRNRQWV